MENYTLLKDAYFGTGGFETGGYLTKHKRESEDDYTFRRKNAYYLNYFAPIVNALVDPIFKKEPLRDYTGAASSFVEAFLDDVDGNGTDIGAFMKRAAIMAKTYGVAFIVVDNFGDKIARSRAEQLAMRKFPYVYVMAPEDVQEYGMDRMGNLNYIKFREINKIDNGATSYRYTTYGRDSWKIEGDDLPVTSGTYNLGRVPVVPLFSRVLEQKTMKPVPELMPIAKTAVSLYNHCSWLGEILRNQTFPLLTIPSLDATELTIGNNNALGYSPDSSHTPDFIAPSSDPAKTLQEQITLLVQEMYRMVNLSYVLGSTPSNVSGVARQWEFERTNQQLANFAHQCEDAEKAVLDLFAAWLNSDIEYTVIYPNDFGVVDVAAQIEQAQAVLDLGLTNGIREEVLKQVITAYCPGISDERFDELVGELRQQDEDELHAEPPETQE